VKRRLEGRVAWITGAGRGLGRAIALAYAEAGAELFLTARTAAELEATAKAAQERGADVDWCTADVRSQAAVDSAVQRALDRFGRVDVLLQNGHDPGDGSVDHHDKAVVAGAPGAQGARRQARADRDPDPALRVFDHKVARRQVKAIDAAQVGPGLAIARQVKHASLLGTEMGQQERAILQQRNAVRLERLAIHGQPDVHSLRAIGPDMRHATAPVGCVDVAGDGRQDAFRTHQPGTHPAHRIQVQMALGQAGACCVFKGWQEVDLQIFRL